MIIKENPFYILQASTRDSRRRLVELVDEQALLQDEQLVADARATLTNPRRRLAAEVAWMPGISPSNVRALIRCLNESPAELLERESLPPLARANLIASALNKLAGNLSSGTIDELKDSIIFDKGVETLCKIFERVGPEEVLALLNQDRGISGFGPISDLETVNQAIIDRRNQLTRLLKAAFDQRDSQGLVSSLTVIVEDQTHFGELAAPQLLDDFIDIYEIEARTYFEKQNEAVKAAEHNVRTFAADVCESDRLDQLVDKLCEMVENWDEIAQPIQISYRSRGLTHEASRAMARRVRNLAVWLYNDHGHLALAQRLTELQKKVFAELDQVVEQAADDIQALSELAEK